MAIDTLLVKEKIKEVLTKSRYEHTLGVAQTAACLAMRYHISSEDAYLAGLLHDNAKCIDDENLRKLCREAEIPMNSVEEKNPYLLHGKLGAYYAKNKFFIENEEICSAIAYHTTGKPGMTLLEQIVFVADYIENGRQPLPGIEAIRQTAFENLELAVFKILESTLNYLRRITSEDSIDPITVETYEYYKKKLMQP